MSTTSILSGPVHPIPVPFCEDQSVDYAALESYCDYLVREGATTLLVTVGTSRFNLLTRDEMLAVNETVSRSGKNVRVIVSGPGPNTGSVQENIEFAKAASKVGADAIIVVFPERHYGDDYLVEFFHAVADSSPIPVWVHAVPMRDGFGGVNAVKQFELEALKRVTSHPNIVGVKEENGDRDLYESIQNSLKDEISIIGAGGAMRRYLKDHPLGAKCYLVGIESLLPALGVKYFSAMSNGDFTLAEKIAADQEDAFFATAVKFGWHRSLKASLSLLGLMPISERSPFPRVDDHELEELRSVMESTGWLKTL